MGFNATVNNSSVISWRSTQINYLPIIRLNIVKNDSVTVSEHVLQQNLSKLNPESNEI
jgi:hypothetical protein